MLQSDELNIVAFLSQKKAEITVLDCLYLGEMFRSGTSHQICFPPGLLIDMAYFCRFIAWAGIQYQVTGNLMKMKWDHQ